MVPWLGFEIYSLVFFIPKGLGSDPGDTADAKAGRGIRKYDRAHAIAHFGPDAHQHLNAASNQFQVDLVDDDEGDAMYNVGVSDVEVGDGDGTAGTPGVVAVQSFRERAGLIETGVFDVRIILTEEPRGIADMIADPSMLIDVVNGSATKLTAGATLKGATEENGSPPSQVSELTRDLVSYIPMEGPPIDANAAALVALPEATGRDNKYYQYFATITPNAGVSGDVTVSIKQFVDSVKPRSKEYLPLTAEQRIAVTLDPDY